MRQPVKGKPHIWCHFDAELFPESPAIFWWTDCDWEGDECMAENNRLLDRWADERIESWARWWRQHQEAA